VAEEEEAELATKVLAMDNQRQEVHKLDPGKLDKTAKPNQKTVAAAAVVVAMGATAAL
jgi:hypothetical protein